MKKLLIAMLFLPVLALAQTITLTAPTLRTDGTALPATQIAGYEVACVGWTPTGGVRGACTQFPTALLPGTSGTLTGTVPASGGTAYWVVRTKDTAALFSAPTVEVSKVFANTVPPNPPTNVVVAQASGIPVSVVFKILTGDVRATPVSGFIQVGKPCGALTVFTYRTQSYKEVLPVDVVKFTTVVFGATDRFAAPCS